MRNIAVKLLLALGIVTIFYSIFLLCQTYSLTNKRVREVVEQQASMALKFDLAIRNYVGQRVRPLMYELVGEDEFVPETMSTSYAARTIFEDVRKEFPDYIIKFSSDNPRNPANQAGPEELKVIEYLNNNPDINRWEGEILIDGKHYMAKFSARRMKESCLRCHGDPKDAPASLLKRYGATAGFNRPIGMIIGSDTVAIPMEKISAQLWSESMQTFLVSGLSLLLFFLAIIYTTRFIITNRLTMISKHFVNATQQEDYSNINPIEIKGRDEISDLAFTFNALTNKLNKFYISLDLQVKERTKALEDVNEQLRQQTEERKQALKRAERLNLLNEGLFGSGSLNEKLVLITDEIVDIFKADFARIWMIKPGDLCDSECQHAKIIEGPHVCRYRELCLHLLASSGRYNHIDGGHRRVPFGCYKIGKVAAEDEPKFLTNDVINDPRIHDHEWAGKLGLVSFAGYRLLSATGRVIGVLALFSKQEISSEEDAQLESLAATTAQIIQTTMADEALRESESRYSALFTGITDAVLVHHATEDGGPGKIIDANDVACKMLGYTREELCGMEVGDIDAPESIVDVHRVVEDLKAGRDVLFEQVHVTKDGRRIPVEVHTQTFEYKGRLAILSTVRDITDRKLAEKEKKKLEAQLQQAQKMESIGTLAGGIAHDFNNILFPIMGFAEMSLDDVPKDGPLRNNIKEIVQGTKRASDLVKQILTFSRQSDRKPKPLKVQLVVKEVLKLIRATIPTTIEIKQDISNDCGLVMADATQFHQVAMNLMTNAFQAMEDEGGKLEVTIKEIELGIDDLKDPSMAPGTYVCLTVADTGIGMDQSVIDRLFEPYFTTKETGKGTGLGLAVVHGIVKSYQGDIKVYSELGKGTAFHVYLPVIKSQFETEKTEAVTPVPKGTERILLVDDEEIIVRMEKQMLERLGYDVTEKTSSVEALEAFRNSPDKFDLVITDMTMPNMTGIQLAPKLLEIKPDIPIIICTGFSTKVDGEKAKLAGIRGYVMKPVIMSEIAKKIREVLDEAERTTQI